MEYSCTVLGDYATTTYSVVFARKVYVSHVILTPGGDDSLGRYGHLSSLKLPAKVQRSIQPYIRSWEEYCLRDSSIQH